MDNDTKNIANIYLTEAVNINVLKNFIRSKQPGSIVRVTYERPCKTLAAFKNVEIIKRTSMSVRVGVEYDNISRVQRDREGGDLPEQNAGLSGMEWTEHPYFVRSLKTGIEMLRAYPVHGQKADTIYTIKEPSGAKIVEKSTIEHMLASSEKQVPRQNAEGEDMQRVVTIKLQDIQNIV